MREVALVFLWTALVGTLCTGVGYMHGKKEADRWYAQHPEDCPSMVHVKECWNTDGKSPLAWGSCQ